MRYFSITLGIVLVFLFTISIVTVNAYQISASTNKITYVSNDIISISGSINTSSSINITATFYNSSSVLSITNSSYNTTVSGPNNTFAMYQAVNGNFSEGSYRINITDGFDNVITRFNVLSQIIYIESYLLGSNEIINVSTTALVTDGSFGLNVSDLLSLSLSRNLHYGNYTNISGDNQTYHFVLIDKNINNSYDFMYVDDDGIFQLYNDSEDTGDVEKPLSTGDEFKYNFIVRKIEPTGNKTILVKPITPVYQQGDVVRFIVFAKNSNGTLLNRNITAALMNSNGSIINITNGTTTDYFVANFTAPSSGNYIINFNNGTGLEFFSVESFELFGKITDLSDSVSSSFSPDSFARIYTMSKTLSGTSVNLSSNYATISYPNGTIRNAILTRDSDGVYKYDLNLSGAPNGEYGVTISGTYDSYTQEFKTGFSIETIDLNVFSINTRYIDQAESQGLFVNAFSPGQNVTIMVILTNISAGGLFAQGPDEGGVIDIDNSTTSADECQSKVSVVDIQDERGISYTPNTVIRNLSSAIASMPVPQGEGPPAAMMRQCIITIIGLNNTGMYKINVQINQNGEIKTAGDSFGIQRLLARGDTVDFKGENSGFFSPNSTVRIKLVINDLFNDVELPASNITTAKIIEMKKEFPTEKDVMRNMSNESIVNGTITFVSPNEEGFFTMRFRFKANVSGIIEEGIGNAFFALKKYIIWGNVPCSNMGPCFVASGQNITMNVNVVDVDKGSLFDLGQTNGLTCTGCTGLVANVSLLRNDQMFKEIDKSQYSVLTGIVRNSTANLTIVPSGNLQSGWYGIDFVLTDPTNQNITYFGFGWFEIRNFYTETFPITLVGGNYTRGQDNTYNIGSPVLFGVVARNPSNPGQILSFNETPVVQSARWVVSWPPPEVQFTASASMKNVSIEGTIEQIWVVNISGLSKEGPYAVNTKVSVSGYSADVGTYWFDAASFRLITEYRGMEQWPAIFATTENLTVNITGINFDNSLHNLSNVKVKEVFNEKTDRPERVNYSVSCSGANCMVNINLSSLRSGQYFLKLTVNDTAGLQKTSEVSFVIQGMVLSIPAIENVDIWYSDNADNSISLGNDRDRCDNQLWFMDDQCSDQNNTVCISGYNITVSRKAGAMHGNVFCIQSNGEWNTNCNGNATIVYAVYFNSTYLWINTTSNLNGSANLSQGQMFLIDKLWNLTTFSRVKAANNIACGDIDLCQNCGTTNYTITISSNYSSVYHGGTNLVRDNQINRSFPDFAGLRYVYMMHNTTHLFMSNTTNFSSATPVLSGQTVSDPYGGRWQVKTLDKQRVVLKGMNVLASSGAFVNVSLSRSGTFRLGKFDESMLGSWDKMSGQRNGLDLDNDGATNGTSYFILADNASAGSYDTFIFSTGSNFTNATSINSDRGNRTFGLNNTMTLLVIDPRADRIILYSNSTGDWADLGEIKLGNNITIPFIVKTPAGIPVTANISIEWSRRRYNSLDQLINTSVIKEASGIGEISINMSSFGSGEYAFEMKASRYDGASEKLDEWRWPRATMRSFLTTSRVGDGGYINGFKSIQLTRYDWESYGNVKQIQSINSSGYFPAVYAYDAGDIVNATTAYNYTQCTFDKPPGATADAANITLRSSLSNPQYYFYLSTNISTVWIKQGDCNFTNSVMYNVSNAVNITNDGHVYPLYVLDANLTLQRVVLGLAGFNSTVIQRISSDTFDNNPSDRWNMMALNISGALYDIVLANDSTDYPICQAWGIDGCVKKTWISRTGNYSLANGTSIGQNFTLDLYLARVGPTPWDGIIIGNFSNLTVRLGIDLRPRDNTPTYIGVINESALSMDLNMNGYSNDTFYAVAYDDVSDSLETPTNIVIDDDTNITEDWWANATDYQDFSSVESGRREFKSNLPNSVWMGSVMFGEINYSAAWENWPQWEILAFNNTDMLISKGKWLINSTNNVTIITKAYTFDQLPIVSANITVASVTRMGRMGFSSLTTSDYLVVNVINATNSYGYGIIKLAPNGTWVNGDYLVSIQIQNGNGVETSENWFRVE